MTHINQLTDNFREQALSVSMLNTFFDDKSASLVLLHNEDLDTALNQHPKLIEDLLCPSELQRFHQFSLEKRRREWLGGRICAKAALQKQLGIPGTSLQDFSIDNNESGRPHAILDLSLDVQVQDIDISISHSGEIACALAANCPCGIDLQEQKDTLLRVRERFCSVSEAKILARFTNIPEKKRLLLLWCAKEALRKACSIFFIAEFLTMQLQHIESTQTCHTLTINHPELKAPIPVVCEFHQGYGLALCLFPEKTYA